MREQLIKKLYEILEINTNYGGGYHFLRDHIPQEFKSGVYFFFEVDNKKPRITYIGITKPNRNNRLQMHKNGASAFRDHIDKAIINKYGKSGPLSVNEYIHDLPYLFIVIDKIEDITYIEKRTIELVSNYNQDTKINIPEGDWLGFNSDSEKVRDSHIWNSHFVANYNEVNNYCGALEKLEKYIVNFKKR